MIITSNNLPLSSKVPIVNLCSRPEIFLLSMSMIQLKGIRPVFPFKCKFGSKLNHFSSFRSPTQEQGHISQIVYSIPVYSHPSWGVRNYSQHPHVAIEQMDCRNTRRVIRGWKYIALLCRFDTSTGESFCCMGCGCIWGGVPSYSWVGSPQFPIAS